MREAIIFLDIDGCLNDHKAHANGYCGTVPHCVASFNRILAAVPEARIVITSAWRYIAGFSDVTTAVMENVLLTHGVNCYELVKDFTRKDISKDRTDRGPQIMEWLWAKAGPQHLSHPPFLVVIDDKDLEITAMNLPFVQTDGNVGLTDADADRAIAILRGEAKADAN